MNDSKSTKSDEKYEVVDKIEVSCFNCGNSVTMSFLKAESMNQTGQEVYCEDCDEDVDFDDDDIGFRFVPFF